MWDVDGKEAVKYSWLDHDWDIKIKLLLGHINNTTRESSPPNVPLPPSDTIQYVFMSSPLSICNFGDKIRQWKIPQSRELILFAKPPKHCQNVVNQNLIGISTAKLFPALQLTISGAYLVIHVLMVTTTVDGMLMNYELDAFWSLLLQQQKQSATQQLVRYIGGERVRERAS